MGGILRMSEKERRRLLACQRVADGQMSVTQAADMLSISVRQMRRSQRRFEQEGDAGLVHRNRGRPSNRAADDDLRTAVLARYAERYEGFGPTFAAEKLAEDGLAVDHETLRRWLTAAGYWKPRSVRARHRSARERKRHFGELVQLDGSHHDWFEGRGKPCCLMQMVDDATGERMMLLSEQETTLDAMRLLRAWLERHGVPKALYTDKKTVYVAVREPTLEEQLEGTEPLTAFGKACASLGIAIIPANSPQAKGRIERANGVAQDRLIKELRLAGACSIEDAYAVLAKGLLDSRFSVPAASSVDFHRPLADAEDLHRILRVREQRVVSNDFTLRYEGRVLQLAKQPGLPLPRSKVTVATCLDGSVTVEHKARDLSFEDVTESLRPKPATHKEEGAPKKHVPPVPGPDHPWRKLPPIPSSQWAAAHYHSQEQTIRPMR